MLVVRRFTLGSGSGLGRDCYTGLGWELVTCFFLPTPSCLPLLAYSGACMHTFPCAYLWPYHYPYLYRPPSSMPSLYPTITPTRTVTPLYLLLPLTPPLTRVLTLTLVFCSCSTCSHLCSS